jgi:hypothetical protein
VRGYHRHSPASCGIVQTATGARSI